MATIAGLSCALVVGAATLTSPDRPAPAAAPARVAACPKPPTGASLAQAWTVANQFIDHAILREQPECGDELVVPSLRNMPLAPFHTEFHKIVRSTSIRVALPRQLGLWVFLEAPDVGRRVYELVLVRRGDRWLVDYWARTADPTDPPFPPDLLAPAAAPAAGPRA